MFCLHKTGSDIRILIKKGNFVHLGLEYSGKGKGCVCDMDHSKMKQKSLAEDGKRHEMVYCYEVAFTL